MLTRKDFKRVADILGAFREGQENGDITMPLEFLIDEFCLWFEGENERFDEQKFRQAVAKNTLQ
jgi:hypothetical protein